MKKMQIISGQSVPSYTAEQIKLEAKELVAGLPSQSTIENNNPNNTHTQLLAEIYHNGTLSQQTIAASLGSARGSADQDSAYRSSLCNILFLAAKKNQTGCFILIATALKKFFQNMDGAKRNPLDAVAVVCFYYAMHHQNAQLLAYLEGNLSQDNAFYNHLFLVATYHADLEVMVGALEMGAEVQAVSQKQVFCNYGFDYDRSNNFIVQGSDALVVLISNHSLQAHAWLMAAKVLMKNGFDFKTSVNKHFTGKKTLLHEVFTMNNFSDGDLSGHMAFIDFLFTAAQFTPADIKVLMNTPSQKEDGRLPIHCAIYNLGRSVYELRRKLEKEGKPFPGDDPAVVTWMLAHGTDMAQEMRNPRFSKMSLHLAAEHDLLNVIKVLVLYGADVNVQAVNKSSNRNTPFHTVCAGCNDDLAEVFSYLIDRPRPVRLDLHDAEGATALLKACRWMKPVYIERLLRAGANALDRDKHGNTALIELACNSNVEADVVLMPSLITTLLARGVAIDAKGSSGLTALQRAAANLSINTVTYLLQRGANHLIRSNKGLNLLDLAKETVGRIRRSDDMLSQKFLQLQQILTAHEQAVTAAAQTSAVATPAQSSATTVPSTRKLSLFDNIKAGIRGIGQAGHLVPRARHVLENSTAEEQHSLLHSSPASSAAATKRRHRSDDDDDDEVEGTLLRSYQSSSTASS